MHENDDIDLNTLVEDDWHDRISFTNTQGQVAHEFASEAQTEATNGHEEATNENDIPANGPEEPTTGPKQDTNGPE